MPKALERALGSLKVWTALGGVALTVAATFGLPADKVSPVVTSIIGLAGAVIAATAYEDGKQKGANTGDGNDPSQTP